MPMLEALKAAVEERKAQAEAAQAADLKGVWEVITSGAVTDEQARSVMEFWHANTSPAFVIRACERDLKVLERHQPGDQDGGGKVCWDHTRRESAPWPCDEVEALAEVYQINLGVSDDS